MSSKIVDFYAGRTVLVTGVTGFLAKVLLFELLTKCQSMAKVYCLIRPHQGMSALDRFEKKIATLPIFSALFERDPSARAKIVILAGDISADNLSIEDQTLGVLEEEINIILHCAATTKFHENLKTAVATNTLGMLHILELAKRCKNLLSLVHVSTAYVNSHQKHRPFDIKEQIYASNIDTREMLERIGRMSAEEAEEKTAEIIAPHPNTYTYTKALAEYLLVKEKGDVPVSIVRPSIVGCSYRSPYPGWIDTTIGANGLFYMTALGILHVMHGSRKYVADFIPVDLAAILVISVAWYTSEFVRNLSNTIKFKDNLPIFHSTTSTQNPMKWFTARHVLLNYFRRHPIPPLYGWFPWMFFVPSKPLFDILNVVLHFFPAAIVDARRILSGKSPVVLSQARRLSRVIDSLGYFSSNEWFFSADHVNTLIQKMTQADLSLFPVDTKSIDWEIYLIHYARGMLDVLKKANLHANRSKF